MVIEEMSSTGGPDFSPDSRRLAVGHADGSIRLYELPSGHQLQATRRHSKSPLVGVPSQRPTVGGLLRHRRPGLRSRNGENTRGFSPARRDGVASPGTLTARRLQRPVTTRGFTCGTCPRASKPMSSRDCGTTAFDWLQPCRRSARQRGLGRRDAAVGPPDRPATVQHASAGRLCASALMTVC